MIKKCKICNKEFESFKNSISCSKDCLRKYVINWSHKYYIRHKKSIFRMCLLCGKEFKVGKNHHKFCSKECAFEYNKRQFSNRYIKRKPMRKKCSYCSKSFIGNRIDILFCSKKCRFSFYNERNRKQKIKKKCEYCNGSFMTKYHKKRFCSIRCNQKDIIRRKIKK